MTLENFFKRGDKPKYVLVTGSRDWNNMGIIEEELNKLEKSTIIVHGGCRGADLMAAHSWKSSGGETIEMKADWDAHGKAAGPIRNKHMLESYPICSAIAFRK